MVKSILISFVRFNCLNKIITCVGNRILISKIAIFEKVNYSLKNDVPFLLNCVFVLRKLTICFDGMLCLIEDNIGLETVSFLLWKSDFFIWKVYFSEEVTYSFGNILVRSKTYLARNLISCFEHAMFRSRILRVFGKEYYLVRKYDFPWK